MSSIYNNIGICPQFDILWSDLNVPEHLYFYARLMGVSAKDERAAVDKYLETVSLKSLEKRLASQLSGGEKRRLSIVALVGNPSAVQPTTGLDPKVRRMIWNMTPRKGKRSSSLLTLWRKPRLSVRKLELWRKVPVDALRIRSA